MCHGALARCRLAEHEARRERGGGGKDKEIEGGAKKDGVKGREIGEAKKGRRTRGRKRGKEEKRRKSEGISTLTTQAEFSSPRGTGAM